jgi:hypothetical protein
MNHFPSIVLVCALAIPVLAQDAKTKALAESNKPADADVQASGESFPASASAVKAPLVLTNDYLILPADQTTDVASGGSAVFNFTITNAGNYLVEALVNAPDEGANSFFLDIDAQPKDPDMIWDIDVTSGFERRTVSWRGNGDADNDQFVPKKFKLAEGAHKLIIVGREPGTQLKSISIRPAPPE